MTLFVQPGKKQLSREEMVYDLKEGSSIFLNGNRFEIAEIEGSLVTVRDLSSFKNYSVVRKVCSTSVDFHLRTIPLLLFPYTMVSSRTLRNSFSYFCLSFFRHTR